MKRTKDVVCAVVDAGLFIHLARRLAADFQKVYYINPSWETAFPRISEGVIGDGYPEIIWTESLFDVIDQIDLAVFPDIGYASLQLELQRRGIAVWGARHADALEARRGLFLDTLRKCGLPTPTYQKIKGIAELRKYLSKHEDKYIKVSTWRGDFETFHWRSAEEDEVVIDSWAVKLGPLRELVAFYVLDPIDAEIEDGVDTWRCGGQWPSRVMHAQECKDKALLATFDDYSNLPEPVRLVNDKFGTVLDSYDYQGFFSTEVRVTKEGDGFFIDPTCRGASPVSQLQCEMIGNLGEVIWQGANGNCIEPQEAEPYGVQAIFCCDRDDWTVLKLKPEIEKHVRVSFSCKVGDLICVPPSSCGPSEIGWLCATGSTIEYALHNLLEYAKEMPSGVEVRTDGLVHLLKETKEAGIDMGQPIPEPSTVVDA